MATLLQVTQFGNTVAAQFEKLAAAQQHKLNSKLHEQNTALRRAHEKDLDDYQTSMQTQSPSGPIREATEAGRFLQRAYEQFVTWATANGLYAEYKLRQTVCTDQDPHTVAVTLTRNGVETARSVRELGSMPNRKMVQSWFAKYSIPVHVQLILLEEADSERDQSIAPLAEPEEEIPDTQDESEEVPDSD